MKPKHPKKATGTEPKPRGPQRDEAQYPAASGAQEPVGVFLDTLPLPALAHGVGGEIFAMNRLARDLFGISDDALLRGLNAGPYYETAGSKGLPVRIWEDLLAGRGGLHAWQVRRPPDGAIMHLVVAVARAVLRDRQCVLAIVRTSQQEGGDEDVSDLQLYREHAAFLAQTLEVRDRRLQELRVQLEDNTRKLDRSAAALQLLISGIEDRKREIQEDISKRVHLRIHPLLSLMRTENVTERMKDLLDAIEVALDSIVSPEDPLMGEKSQLLTLKEIRICEMIRSGLSSKEIANIMGVSPKTTAFHRNKIRKKLGLTGTDKELASFLLFASDSQAEVGVGFEKSSEAPREEMEE